MSIPIEDLKDGEIRTIKVRNVFWTNRDQYAPGVMNNEFNIYTGEIVLEDRQNMSFNYKHQSTKPPYEVSVRRQEYVVPKDHIGLATGNLDMPLRVIHKDNIINIS